jgi:4-oxalocrotonate tautomerase
MPYINVRITRDGVTPQQKKQIVEEMTHTLVSVLGKKPEHITSSLMKSNRRTGVSRGC